MNKETYCLLDLREGCPSNCRYHSRGRHYFEEAAAILDQSVEEMVAEFKSGNLNDLRLSLAKILTERGTIDRCLKSKDTNILEEMPWLNARGYGKAGLSDES